MKQITVVLLCLVSLAVAAEDNRRDGNWWLQLNDATKQTYLVGLFDGVPLGHHFSYWGVGADGKPFVTPDSGQGMIKSFDAMYSKYMTGVTNSQLADGLTAFYLDFRNRKIRVQDASWIVLSQIAGTPQTTIDKMIDGWRSNAN